MPFTTSYWPADTSADVLHASVGDLLRSAAAQHPRNVALVAVEEDGTRRQWTYEELLEEATHVAHALLARFTPGERVAVWSPNCVEWILLEWAAGLAGIVLVTVNPALRRDEAHYVLGQSRAAGLVLADEHRGNPMLEHLKAVRAELPHLREVIRLAEWDDFWAAAVPTDLPVVDPHYLDDPGDVDVLVRGIEISRDLVHTRAFDGIRGRELAPGDAITDRAGLARYVRANASTVWHPVGTCRMGGDRDGVVDARLRVHGVTGLRVADASVMPTITCGNTNAATIMIAERAADLIAAGGTP